jgi:hypothetical protein
LILKLNKVGKVGKVGFDKIFCSLLKGYVIGLEKD